MKWHSRCYPTFFAGLLGTLLLISILFVCLGYQITEPQQWVLLILCGAIFIPLSALCVIYRNKKSKQSISASYLPLIAVMFLLIGSLSYWGDPIFWAAYSAIILSASYVVFFLCGRGRAVRWFFGIITFLLCILLAVSIMLSYFFVFNFVSKSVIKQENSPNGQQFLVLEEFDQGALGLDTVLRLKERPINLGIFTLKDIGKDVYPAEDYEQIQLQWLDENRFQVNGRTFDLKNKEFLEQQYHLSKYAKQFKVSIPDRKADELKDNYNLLQTSGTRMFFFSLSEKEKSIILNQIKELKDWSALPPTSNDTPVSFSSSGYYKRYSEYTLKDPKENFTYIQLDLEASSLTIWEQNKPG